MADTPDTLPTKEELAQLPVRAIVAYAARCARRVQPLYPLAMKGVLTDSQLTKTSGDIHHAITLAEKWLRNESVSETEFFDGEEAVRRTASEYATYSTSDFASAAHVADAASRALAATRTAISSAQTADVSRTTDTAMFAANVALRTADAAARTADAAMAATRTMSLGGSQFRASSRRDFEILRARQFKPDAMIDASEAGVCGELWIDEPPEWYTEGLEQLRKWRILNKASRRKTSAPAASTEELQKLRAEQERLQRERKSLESNLETARAEAARYQEEIDKAEAFARNQEDERRNEAAAHRLTEQRASLLEVELRKTQSDLLHTNTQLEIALIGQSEAKEELELRQPQSLGWYGRMFFRAENILNSITVVVLCAIVGFALIGIGEVYERQALDRWVKARSDEYQDRAFRSNTASVETKFDNGRPTIEKAQVINTTAADRDTFEMFHSRIMILSIAGATSPDDTIAGLREQLRKVQVEMAGEAFPPQPAQGPLSWWRSLISWPQYWSSDLLLSLVVLFSATIGAVITTMRRNDRLSFRDMGLGVSAGFITFLIVRGGKSVFLVDADPLLLINPYNSAFFGMLAGMFTELTFGLLGLFAKEFSERLKRVVKLVFSEPLPSDEKRPKPDTPPDPEKQNRP